MTTSEEPKIWPVLLVAALMVASIGTVFVIGSDSEPDLPLNTNMMLTYRVTGGGDLVGINGSFGEQLNIFGERSYSRSGPYDEEGGLELHLSLPAPLFSVRAYLDEVSLNTTWGTKAVWRSLDMAQGLGHDAGMCVVYRGAHTNLAYRVDLISSDYRATYELVDVDGAEMSDLDLNGLINRNELIEQRRITSTTNVNVDWSCDLKEPGNGESYQFNYTGEGFQFIVFDETDIWNMVNGGDYQYNEEWSVIGNGSVEFLLEDGMVWFMTLPINYELGFTYNRQLKISIIDE